MKIENILDAILEMQYKELMRILKVATYRWGELFPDWEILTVSVSKNDPEYKKCVIESVFKMLEREKENNTVCVFETDLPETTGEPTE